jgi:BON domain
MFRAFRAAGVGLFLGLGAPCDAGGILPVTPPDRPAAARDLGLTIHARRLLLLDPELAGLNLGVRVRNRVAILWGPVPSAELAFKAEVCLRGLVELREVHNELFVTGEDLPAGTPGLPSPPLFLPPETPPALPMLPPGDVPPPPPRQARPVPAAQPPPPVESDVEMPPVRLPR